MKKKLSKKAIIIIISVVVAVLFIVFAMVIPFLKSRRQAALFKIEQAVKDIFIYPTLVEDDDISRLQGSLEEITDTQWMEEEFKKQGAEAIRNFDFDPTNLSYSFYEVKKQQIVLEELGYECPELKSTFDALLRDAVDNYASAYGFAGVAEDVLEGPIVEKETYDLQLSYYSDPQSILLNDYAPSYFAEAKEAAFSTKDTGELLKLCKELAAVSMYTDVSGLADVETIVNYLTTGAEEITVREGEGYYADRTDDSDSDFEKDEIWNEYLPGDYTHSTVSSVKYYGDLASSYFVSQGNYTREDENGNKKSDTYTNHESTKLYLKGELIGESSVDSAFIKYAYEDGMVSYHKDGYCFAVSDHAVVCFIDDGFIFEFA